MVGFNRRFAPLVKDAKRLLQNRARPIAVSITCNAGSVPPDHWVHDQAVGGGRLVGEGCHFIDLAAHLVGAPLTSVYARGAPSATGSPSVDTATMSLAFADGSVAAIAYLSNGSPRFPKERVEVHSDGRVLQIDNFKVLRSWGFRQRPVRLRRQDKGHAAAVDAFVRAVRTGGPSPIAWEDLLRSSAGALAVLRSLEEGVPIDIDAYLGEALA